MRTLYTLIYIFCLPLILLRLLYRAQKAPAYKKRIGERFAQVPARQGSEKLIWLHAVSVGEVLAAVPLVKALQKAYPEHRICITTTTPTGSERVKASFGNSVLHYYLPYDLPSLLVFFCRQIRPKALIIMETELWPNLLAVCHYLKIPVILANGRMSERSKNGYKKLASLSRPMFRQLNLLASQAESDSLRFLELGAQPEALITTGSIKFDVKISDGVTARLNALKNQLQIEPNRRVVIFASTHQGEDERIIPIIKQVQAQHSELLALIVPRHPERFDDVAEIAKEENLSLIRCSENQPVTKNSQIILGDTMGDLLAYYGLADLVFIGGSLVKTGGHNMLEAALWSLPIMCGPHLFNFQSISDALMAEKAMIIVQDENQLSEQLANFLNTPEAFTAYGENANKVLLANQGALDKLVTALHPFL